MRGENAAIIVQAEEHIIQAERELKIAIERCEELRRRVTKSNVIEELGWIIMSLQLKLSNSVTKQLQARLHRLWSE
jgi:hypothetical protein